MEQLHAHTSKDHYKKYKQMVKDNAIKLPEGFLDRSDKELAQLFKEDENLNNIPLHEFDLLFPMIRGRHSKAPETPAENVCMYKHALIFQRIKAKAIFFNNPLKPQGCKDCPNPPRL